MYSIKHNSIYRDEDLIAEIQANGMVEFISPELEKFRLPVWNLLADAGRINKVDNGVDLAVYFQQEEEEKVQESKEDKEFKNFSEAAEQQVEDDSKLVIRTVTELREVVQQMTGEAAPYLSQSMGDKTPELWAYFRRHIDMFPTIKAAYVIDVNLDRLDRGE